MGNIYAEALVICPSWTWYRQVGAERSDSMELCEQKSESQLAAYVTGANETASCSDGP